MGNIKAKAGMTAQQLAVLTTEMDKRRRSTGLSYFLLFILSGVGAHQWYLGNKKRAATFMGAFGGAYFCWFSSFGTMISGTTASANAAPDAARKIAESAGHAGAVWIILAILCMLVFGALWVLDLVTLAKQADQANERIEGAIISDLGAS